MAPSSADIAIFGARRSRFAAALEQRLGSRALALELDAPLAGAPVTMTETEIRWQGADLMRVAAAFVERPLFAWPQSVELDGPDERERRALAQSAIERLAERVRVAPGPAAAHLAAAATNALERAQRAGIPVHAWRVEWFDAPPQDGSAWFDLGGRVYGYEPLESIDRGPAWKSCAKDGPFVSVFAVDGAPIAASLRADVALHRRGADWGRALDPREVAPLACERARLAARALELEFAGFTFDVESSTLASVEAAPNFELWNEHSGGRVADACAARLVELARSPLEVQP